MSNVQFDLLKRYARFKVSETTALNNIFEVTPTSTWKGSKPRGKTKKRREKEKKESGHTSGGYQATAVIHKTGDYSGNFSYFIRSSEGKSRAGVYDEISSYLSTVYTRKYPLVVKFAKEHFKLSSIDCNFSTKASYKKMGKKRASGQSKPYTWEAHHLIPGDVFTQIRAGVSESKPIFTETHLDLILLSDYDLNSGHNLIALPSNGMDVFQLVHALIQHPSNHPEYTNYVLKNVKTVKSSLEDLEDEIDKPHPDVEVKIGDDFRAIEDQLWDLIVKLGNVAIAKVLKQEHKALEADEENLIKSDTADGLQYSLKALG